jgi:hypothetical protein
MPRLTPREVGGEEVEDVLHRARPAGLVEVAARVAGEVEGQEVEDVLDAERAEQLMSAGQMV